MRRFLLLLSLFGFLISFTLGTANAKEGLYVSVSAGSTVSSSFGTPPIFGYSAIYYPLEMLHSGMLAGAFGYSYGYFRVELSYMHMFQDHEIIRDNRFFTSEYNTANLPSLGKEILTHSIVTNLYLDMKFVNETLYPYIGVGVGNANIEFSYIDLEIQFNGLGEQYTLEKRQFFGQVMIGGKLDIDIIPSSLYLEYRGVATQGMDLEPLNDGIQFSSNPDDIPEDYVSPTTKTVNFLHHGIVLGFSYFIF